MRKNILYKNLLVTIIKDWRNFCEGGGGEGVSEGTYTQYLVLKQVFPMESDNHH